MRAREKRMSPNYALESTLFVTASPYLPVWRSCVLL